MDFRDILVVELVPGTRPVTLEIRATPTFCKAWVERTGKPPSSAAELAFNAFRFAGRVRVPKRPWRVRLSLRVDPNLVRTAYVGSYLNGRITVTVALQKVAYGFLSTYRGLPAMPQYTCHSMPHAVVAGVAHETLHWTGACRSERRSEEYLCELMAACALQHQFREFDQFCEIIA